MAPPALPGSPPAVNNACDLSPIHLATFKQLPPFDKLPPAQQADSQVKMFYGMVQATFAIDQSFGDNNESLSSIEVDQFIKANPQDNPEFTTCNFMGQIRSFLTDFPKLKAALDKGPDTTPIPLAGLKSLPELEKFPILNEEDFKDSNVVQSKLSASALSEPFKKLFSERSDILFAYFLAQAYLASDLDKNGELSLKDLQTLLAQKGQTGIDATLMLSQARETIAQASELGFQIRGQEKLPQDPNAFDLSTFFGLAQVAAELILADPTLSAILDIVAPIAADGKRNPVPEISDGYLSVEKLEKLIKKNPSITLDAKSAFEHLQSLESALSLPYSLWPSDLQNLLESAGEDTKDKISLVQNLSEDYRKTDFVIRMLEQLSASQYEQQKLDHAGTEGSFLSGLSYVITGGHWSWNKHFQEEKPQLEKEGRDAAISTLKEVLKKNKFEKIEEAIGYMAANGKFAEVTLLKGECELDQWVEISKETKDVDRNQKIREMATYFREGRYKFWEFPILPLPRLGKGGFFERASSLSNWTFKSPELIETLALDNYLAGKTPNLFDLKNNPGIEDLAAQLNEADRKTLQDLFNKLQKGQDVEVEKIPGFLVSTSLTPEGQEEILVQTRASLTILENTRLLQNSDLQAQFKALPDAQAKEAESILKGVAGLNIPKEAALQHFKESNYPSKFYDEAEKVFKKMGTQTMKAPASRLEVLFREARFPNEARVREIFNLAQPSALDKAEFSAAVKASKLSASNQANLLAAFLIQPNNQIAEAAQDEFFAILGYPTKDPASGEWDRTKTGSLHTAIKSTAAKGIFGVGLYTAPTAVGGGFGWALGKLPIIARVLGTRSPVIGATVFGAIGAAWTLSPYGEGLRDYAHQGLSFPYFKWSDFAVMDAGREAAGLYIDFNVGLQGMEAVVGGFKALGALELGTRFANAVRLPAGWGASAGRTKNFFSNLGARLMGKTQSEIAEEALKKAGLEGVPWAADVQGLSTAERVWAKAQYETLQAEATKAREFFAATHADAAELIQLQEQLASSTLSAAERTALEARLSATAQRLPEAMKTRLIEINVKVRSFEVLGKVGPLPQFSGRILRQAMKWKSEGEALIKEGEREAGEALLKRAEILVQNGAVQYVNLPRMAMQNTRLGKAMIWSFFAENIDNFTRPPTPLAPDFPEDINVGILIPPRLDPPPAPKK